LFFNFQNPLAARDNTLQGAADNFQLVRLAQTFAHSDPNGPGDIRFDPDRIYFFGHSQGGLTGPPFLAHEPLVQGAVLSGAGGLLYLSMLLKTEPVDVAGLVATVIRDYPLDEFNPVLAMLQMFVDRADPVVYGPKLVREPLPGVAAKHIYQSEGFTDRYTPVPSIEAFATAIGGNQVEPVLAPIAGLELRDNRVLTAPVTANAGGVTAVLAQYNELDGSDGHFVVFNVDAARAQSAQFLSTLAETGTATLVAP
jgi:pimeloyl-ACP methyl ester carboxylesterase